jgi:hypothetical protein
MSPRGRKLNSRYRRTKPTPNVSLTKRDVDVLLDCAYLRAIPGYAMYLLAASSSRFHLPPRSYWKARENQLYQGEWLSRIYPPQSFYVSGGTWPIYIMEPGYVSYAIDAGKALNTLTDADRKKFMDAASGMRARLHSFMAYHGIEGDVADSMLTNNGLLAEKFCAGKTSKVPHTLLASTFLALAWYGLRRAGYTIENRLPDGFIDWAYKPKDGSAVRHIRPDAFFTIDHPLGLFGFALEAETGETGYKMLVQKIRAYTELAMAEQMAGFRARTGCDLKSFRVLFYCATAAHAQIVQRAIAEVSPRGSGWFLVVSADAMHLDYSKMQFQTNAEIEGEGPLYDYLADLVLRPIFAQVEGSTKGVPTVGYHALVDGPRIPAEDEDLFVEVTDAPEQVFESLGAVAIDDEAEVAPPLAVDCITALD